MVTLAPKHAVPSDMRLVPFWARLGILRHLSLTRSLRSRTALTAMSRSSFKGYKLEITWQSSTYTETGQQLFQEH